MRVEFILVSCLGIVSCFGCHANNYAQRGSAVGGLSGAGLGAIVGEIAGDNPVAGAAIGGTVGALTGATVGAGLDEVDAANRYRVQQAAYQQAASGTTLDEIVSMSNAGLSDDIISRHVQSEGFAGRLDAGDLIALRQQGVSDRIIAELQSRSHRPAVQVAAAETIVDAPVIVEERYHAVPVFGPRCPPPRAWRSPARLHRHRPGFHWGIAFGN